MGAAAVSGAVWLRIGYSSAGRGPDASLMSAITVERDLRLPVRVEFRELERDLLEGRLSPAEYDALVDELLVALGVPLAEAED